MILDHIHISKVSAIKIYHTLNHIGLYNKRNHVTFITNTYDEFVHIGCTTVHFLLKINPISVQCTTQYVLLGQSCGRAYMDCDGLKGNSRTSLYVLTWF